MKAFARKAAVLTMVLGMALGVVGCEVDVDDDDPSRPKPKSRYRQKRRRYRSVSEPNHLF